MSVNYPAPNERLSTRLIGSGRSSGSVALLRASQPDSAQITWPWPASTVRHWPGLLARRNMTLEPGSKVVKYKSFLYRTGGLLAFEKPTCKEVQRSLG